MCSNIHHSLAPTGHEELLCAPQKIQGGGAITTQCCRCIRADALQSAGVGASSSSCYISLELDIYSFES